MSARTAAAGPPSMRRPVERRNTAAPGRRVTARPRHRLTAATVAANPPRAPFIGLVVVLLGGGLLGLLGLNTALAQGAFRQHDLERQVAALGDQQQALQQRVAQLAAPSRLAQQAKALGMVAMVDPAFIRASDGRVLGKAEPAAGVPVTSTPTQPTTTGSGQGTGPVMSGSGSGDAIVAPGTATGLGAGVTAPTADNPVTDAARQPQPADSGQQNPATTPGTNPGSTSGTTTNEPGTGRGDTLP